MPLLLRGEIGVVGMFQTQDAVISDKNQGLSVADMEHHDTRVIFCDNDSCVF